MRIATYNVEWFAGLFNARGEMLDDNEWSARHDITRRQQLHALGAVFRAVDADAFIVVEAPDNNSRRKTVPMLEAFAHRFGLRQRRALLGFENETQQEIALLYDPARLTARHDPKGEPGPHAQDGIAPRFDSDHDLPDGGGGVPFGRLRFNKPPLELAVETARGTRFRLIGVHLKSKNPGAARTPSEMRRIGAESRREHLLQCQWLRARVLEHLAAGDSLIVAGDLNDGPGLDDFENLYGRSGVEIVMGWNEPKPERLFDPHARAALVKKLAAAPATARFFLAEKGQFFSALLDYVMVSPDLRAKGPNWRIWHPFDEPGCYGDPDLREALLTASDHFPVSVDIDL